MRKKIINLSLLASMFSSSLFAGAYGNIDLYSKKKIKEIAKEKTISVVIKEDKDLFKIADFIKSNKEYQWIIDPQIVLDKEYRYSTFPSDKWIDIIKEIAEYEDMIINVDEVEKTISLYMKTKTKIEIDHLPPRVVSEILGKMQLQYSDVEIYKYKSVIYIEGEKLRVETVLDQLKEYSAEVRKSNKKYVVNVYKMQSKKTGLTPMIDKFEIERENKVVIKNPKLNKGYLIKLGTKSIIVKINSNNIEINGVTIDKIDLKYYGYSIDSWFIEVRPVQI